MARSRTLWVSPLIAVCSTGFVLAVAQDRDAATKPSRQPREVPAGVAAAPPMDMQRLLLDWQGQSAKLKSLEVSIYRIDKDPAWNEEEHYIGSAAFRHPQLAFLDFRKVKLQPRPDPKDKNKKVYVAAKKKNGTIDAAPFETIVCTGQEVWHYRYDVTQIFIYPLDKNQRKRALEEGPLPFLFNMRAAEAQQRYDMVLRSENEKHYLVEILPKLPEDKESFSVAWVYLDKNYLLPTRIALLAPDRKSSKDFHLSNIQPNKAVEDRKFVGVDPGKPWKVERNPAAMQAAAPAKAQAPRRPPVGNAAQRPRDPGVAQPR